MNDPAFLRLIWLASPALPVGGFSYSEGLESAIERGLVADEAGAARWLQDQLSLTLARSELPLLAAALRAWQAQDLPRLHALNDWQLHTRETHELRRQTEQMGRAMLDWLRAHDATDPRLGTLASLAPAPSWPLAFALAAVQAAMKAVPLGQRAGQRVLAQLAGALPGCVESALACGDEARQSYSPMLAIVSALHETQYSRLFRS